MHNQILRREDILRWIAFIGIALTVLMVYYPVLFFPPRADQVGYLAEIAQKSDAWGLIVGSYDLNRHLIYGSGDELLFRPLVYALLGAEQFLFGHNFWAWQFLSLVAHLVLIWLLLRLFWHLAGGGIAFAGAWLFALSLTNYELVTWPHLTSYLVMMIFLVLAIEQLVICCQQQRLPMPQLMRMFVYFTIACFIYETVNIYLVWIIVALMVFFPAMRVRALVLAVPIVFYVWCSWYNYIFVNHLSHISSSNEISLIRSFIYGLKLCAWWVYEGMFCGMYNYLTAIRTMFRLDEVMVFKSLQFHNPQVLCGLILSLIYVTLVWFNRHQVKQRLKLFLIFLGMLVIYIMVIVLGRQTNPYGLQEVVRVNSYYIYMFWMLILIMAFTVLGNDQKNKIKKSLVINFILVSLISGVWQGIKIHQMTSKYSQNTNSIILLIKTLDLLVSQKGHENDFSFYVEPHYPGNYTLGVLHKNTDPEDKEYSLVQLIYPQYFRSKEQAKYKFLVS